VPLNQVGQYLEGFGLQRNFLAATPQESTFRIQQEVSETELAVASWPRARFGSIHRVPAQNEQL
jgi:hypothetical protein